MDFFRVNEPLEFLLLSALGVFILLATCAASPAVMCISAAQSGLLAGGLAMTKHFQRKMKLEEEDRQALLFALADAQQPRQHQLQDWR